MALFTSTPKSKLLIEEKVTLLTLDSEDEGECVFSTIIFLI